MRRVTRVRCVLAVIVSTVIVSIAGCSRAEPGTPAAGTPIASTSAGSADPTTAPTTSAQPASSTVVVTQLVPTTPPAPPPVSSTSPPSTPPAPPPTPVPVVWTFEPNAVGESPVPAFPDTLPKWQLNDTWDATPRAFDTDWTQVPGGDGGRFPSTMNGCDLQRFLIRWRAVDDGATINARWVDDAGTPGDSVTAGEGWFDLDGCETPEFHFAGGAGGSTLADVAVSVQQYYPAA